MGRTITHEEAKRFYDRLGAREDSFGRYSSRARRALIARSDFEHAEAVFEFGCGTGRFGAYLLGRRLSPSAHYTGVDVSSTMVALARRTLEAYGPRARVIQSDGSMRLPAEDGSCDRFVSASVLDLLSVADGTALLGEAHRILTTGGLLCLMSLSCGVTGFARLIARLWGTIAGLVPAKVGGCRPIELRTLLRPELWEIVHRSVTNTLGVPNETIVARRRIPAA